MTKSSAAEGVEKHKPLYIAGRKYISIATLEKFGN